MRKRTASSVNETGSPEATEALRRVSDKVHGEGRRLIALMRRHPSDSELRFKSFLDENHIRHTFQKVFYRSIQGNPDFRDGYYIAQFWLYKKHLFIEVGGSRVFQGFTPEYRIYDTIDINPKAQCLRICEEALDDLGYMDRLRCILE